MVIWITGLSGAGKTTLSQALAEILRPSHPQTVLIDGDVVRDVFAGDIDHREESRRIQIGRIQRLSKYLSDQGLLIIVAALYANSDLLRWNRENLGEYFEVYLKAPLCLVTARDSKGIYAKAKRGEMANVVGIDIPWHEPMEANLIIDAEQGASPRQVACEIIAMIPRLSRMLEK